MSEAEARVLADQPFIRSVALRPLEDKIEKAIGPYRNGSDLTIGSQAAIFAILAISSHIDAVNVEDIVERLKAGIRSFLGHDIPVTIRSAAANKLEVVAPIPRLHEIAVWLATRSEISWIERRQRFAPRNFAAGKVLLSGPGEDVRLETTFATRQFQLDGKDQAPLSPISPDLPRAGHRSYNLPNLSKNRVVNVHINNEKGTDSMADVPCCT